MRHVKTLLTLVVVAAVAGPAAADWDGTGEKYVQWPDLDPPVPIPGTTPPEDAPPGIDVKATTPKVLADDFPCEETGYITQVHIWGSWKDDLLPQTEVVDIDDGTTFLVDDPSAVSFRVSFHDNILPGVGGINYSRPADPPLWEAIVPAWGSTVSPPFTAWEGWYDPNTEEYDPWNHQLAWLYNFDLEGLLQGGFLYDPLGNEITELFKQEGTAADRKIYWLNIEASPLPIGTEEVQFGWKSSTDHFEDDAVWKDSDAAAMWNELRYPVGHPYEGQSIDLAFVIVPEPATLALLALGGGLALLRRRRRR